LRFIGFRGLEFVRIEFQNVPVLRDKGLEAFETI